MDVNPYEAPRHAIEPKPKRRPRQDWIDRVIRWLPMPAKVATLILFAVFCAYLLIPAFKAAGEHQHLKNKYTRDPETGYIIPK
jgi:hypothetical protein